jgi:hypothetical protein
MGAAMDKPVLQPRLPVRTRLRNIGLLLLAPVCMAGAFGITTGYLTDGREIRNPGGFYAYMTVVLVLGIVWAVGAQRRRLAAPPGNQ